jgi:predicted Zn-dependent protease
MKSEFISIVIFFIIAISYGQDFSYDKQIGAEAAVQVEQTIGIYPDSNLTAYINSVGQRLAGVLGEIPVDFQFSVLDMAEPNAFALPGGYVYVSRGLLSLVNDEAELAGILGHEMIHVTKRHSVKQMKKSIFPGLLQIPGAIVGIFNSELGTLINTPVSLGTELFLSNYSRKQESEADRLGISLAAEAGYDPEKLAEILNHLASDVELLTGEAEKKSYFSSHPFTPTRIENINKEAEAITWQEKPSILPDKTNLYRIFDGLVYGQNPAQGIFDSNIFIHPDLEIAIVFPPKWQTFNYPVAVGATQPENEGKLVFMIENAGTQPDSLGKAFAEQMKKEYNLIPDESMPVEINGNQGWMISVSDNTGQQPVKVQLYWLDIGDIVLNATGVGLPGQTRIISDVVNSIRKLTPNEKNDIFGTRLRVASALQNESMESFIKRTNCRWDVFTLALKNGLKKDYVLTEGETLKITLIEPYLSH